MTKRRSKHTGRRTVSLLLALVMLTGILPQLTLPAWASSNVSGGNVDGIEYEIHWSDDEWGAFNANIECPNCGIWWHRECSSGDDAMSEIEDMISDDIKDCKQHCNECYEEAHCVLCHNCMDEEGTWCECESKWCLECHEDSWYCDICGSCMVYGEDLVRNHVNTIPDLNYICDDCLADKDECSLCGYPVQLGGYVVFDEMGMDWCSECDLCGNCYADLGCLADAGHCINCLVCGYEETVCEECNRCLDCAYGVTHCPECDTCFREEGEIPWCPSGGEHCAFCCEENGWLCDGCGECTEARGLEFCDDCNLCEECCLAFSEELGCTHGYCVLSSDFDEHLCPNCGGCPDDMECEYCGMCEECQGDYHCDHEICPENDSEWEEHLCDGCGDCFELDELCELCHMCETCWEHCEHELCPEDPDYEDHFCDQCGDCFEESEFCDTCELCLNCCEDNTVFMGCDHEICIESDDFQDHYCFADGQCLVYCEHENCTHSHVSDAWEKNGASHWRKCEDCGASVDCQAHTPGDPITFEQPDPMTGANGKARISCKVCGKYMETVTIPCIQIPKDGTPYIISEPKDYEGKVNTEHVPDGAEKWTTLKVRAGGDDLTYRWYEKKGSGAFKPISDTDGYYTGCTTPNLHLYVYTDACNYNYQYYCVVKNSKGSATTRTVTINANHVYGEYRVLDESDNYHALFCVGEGCDAHREKTDHRYGDWQLIRKATSTQMGLKEAKCMDCGFTKKYYIPKTAELHIHLYLPKKNQTKHWYGCSCGVTMKKEEHTFGAWSSVRLPTVEEEGRRERTCSVCGYVDAELIPKLTHTHDFKTKKDRNEDAFALPNGYIKDDCHVRYCAKCSSTHEEPHNYGYWNVLKTQYTDSHGIYHQTVLSRACITCGHEDQKYCKGKWPVLTEVWNQEQGWLHGGPAGVSGTAAANPGDTVTIQAAPFDGYILADEGRQGIGAWSLEEVSDHDSIKIDGVWYDFKNEDIKDAKLNADGSITFTMPDGPVALGLFPTKCDHKGYGTQDMTIAATCTGYGSKVKVCKKCNAVVSTTEILEPIGHKWIFNSIETDGDCANRQIDCYRCTVCGEFRNKHGDYVHEWVEVGNREEPSCLKAGHESDLECKYCDASKRGERIPAYGSHDWNPWDVVKAATNKVKGQRVRECACCGFTQKESIDFTGPDYRIRADKTKISFDFTYGEQPEPIDVHFTSVGRTTARAITDVDERALGQVTTQKWDGMTLTVGAVPQYMLWNMDGEAELLDVWEVDGIRLAEEDTPQIEVRANIRKTAEQYQLQVEGGYAYIKDKGRAGNRGSISAQGGEMVVLEALPGRKADFLRWEIVRDDSGLISSMWSDTPRFYKDDPVELYMSPNDVTVRALYKGLSGVCQITFDPNGGHVENSAGYTNSSGEIDNLAVAWRVGYDFDGWWTKASGGTRVDVGTKLSQDSTFYAHWKKPDAAAYPPVQFTQDSSPTEAGQLTVDINAMGQAYQALLLASYGGDLTYQWLKDGTLIQGETGRTLQIPKGWKGSAVHAVVCFSGHQIVGEPVTILGEGESAPAVYTVIFDPTGGAVSPGSRQTAADGRFHSEQDLPKPERAGFTFQGWFTEPEGGEKITLQTVYLKNTTVYAHWARHVEYPLKVDSTTVTTANCADVLGNGVFSFDGEKTLTVRGDHTAEKRAIENLGVRGLIIKVEKDSVLRSRDGVSPIITTSCTTTITGPGKLTLISGDTGLGDTGLYVHNGNDVIPNTLTIKDIDLVSEGFWGIAAIRDVNRISLVIDHANVTTRGKESAICDFYGGITIRNAEIVKPADGTISTDGKDVVDASGTLAKEVQIKAIGSGVQENPFTDVTEGAYYYDPVLWAVNHTPQITNGTSATTFSPDKTCTRAQVVTFLWRAMGEPEPTQTANPFTDVRSDQYYYKAVLWAVEKNITNGTSATTFSPDKGCTRAQVVTFLWRAEGQPAHASSVNPFKDVPAGQYYYKPVLWAVEKNITKGTSADKFSPDSTCTRGQIVTFLYRDMN